MHIPDIAEFVILNSDIPLTFTAVFPSMKNKKLTLVSLISINAFSSVFLSCVGSLEDEERLTGQ